MRLLKGGKSLIAPETLGIRYLKIFSLIITELQYFVFVCVAARVWHSLFIKLMQNELHSSFENDFIK
jgi:hypothetical protein